MIKFAKRRTGFRFPNSMEAGQAMTLAALLESHGADLIIYSQAETGSLYCRIVKNGKCFYVRIADHPSRFSAKRCYNSMIKRGDLT